MHSLARANPRLGMIGLTALSMLVAPAARPDTPGQGPALTSQSKLDISTDQNSVNITVPQGTQYLQIATNTADGSWFNFPANALDGKQQSLNFDLKELPNGRCYFRSVCGSALLSLEVHSDFIERFPDGTPWYHHTVKFPREILFNSDGSINPAMLNRFEIHISTTGEKSSWSVFYKIDPASTQAGIMGPQSFFFKVVDLKAP